MQDGIHHNRPTRFRRACPLGVATLLTGFLLAGCGGTSSSSTTASPGGAIASQTSTTNAASAPAAGSPGVAYSECMRSSGVPNFPDPNPGRGLLFSATGIDRSSPAFKAAQAKCQKLLPGGGPPGPGTTTHPSAQTMAKLVKIAQCMREHGVPQFPDPRTSVPQHPFASGMGVITDYDDAILLFPSTLNMHSPAYDQAVVACGVLAGKLGRGPH